MKQNLYFKLTPILTRTLQPKTDAYLELILAVNP